MLDKLLSQHVSYGVFMNLNFDVLELQGAQYDNDSEQEKSTAKIDEKIFLSLGCFP